MTLAAYLLPAALGDASLAGLPSEAGLYACLFGGLVFWLFCSSRQTSITVTSAISLLIGSTLGGMAGGDPARYSALAACTALLVGVIAFLAWLARAGSAVSFISESVMIGFKSGVALHLASTQLPKLFGVKGGHDDFWERMHVFLQHIGETNTTSLLLGCAALALLILGKKLLPNKPVALFVVIAGIAVATFIDLGAHGVKLLGEVPRGLPMPSLPDVHYPGCARADAARARVLPPRRGRDGGDRPDVCREARLPARQQPGTARASPARISPPASARASRSAAACRNRSSMKAAARARRSRA